MAVRLKAPRGANAAPPPDELFCGELNEHDCTGADCPRRPAGRNVGFAAQERDSEDVCDE